MAGVNSNTSYELNAHVLCIHIDIRINKAYIELRKEVSYDGTRNNKDTSSGWLV
jgi:hypothetical protein